MSIVVAICLSMIVSSTDSAWRSPFTDSQPPVTDEMPAVDVEPDDDDEPERPAPQVLHPTKDPDEGDTGDEPVRAAPVPDIPIQDIQGIFKDYIPEEQGSVTFGY